MTISSLDTKRRFVWTRSFVNICVYRDLIKIWGKNKLNNSMNWWCIITRQRKEKKRGANGKEEKILYTHDTRVVLVLRTNLPSEKTAYIEPWTLGGAEIITEAMITAVSLYLSFFLFDIRITHSLRKNTSISHPLL